MLVAQSKGRMVMQLLVGDLLRKGRLASRLAVASSCTAVTVCMSYSAKVMAEAQPQQDPGLEALNPIACISGVRNPCCVWGLSSFSWDSKLLLGPVIF